ncbi:MAG: DUF2281 domain-containing protein [Bacteroidales bacterium]|nr:DUF2281 domain-containing protein [Bacteroidales bacterium]
MIYKNQLFANGSKIGGNRFIDCLLSKRKSEAKKQPKFGCAKGQIYLLPDFDEPLEDFRDFML